MFEASFHEERHHLLSDSEGDFLQLPVVAPFEGRLVCEFKRLRGDHPVERLIQLIEAHVLRTFLRIDDPETLLEWVDLDRRRWAHGALGSTTDLTWHSGAPPGVERRQSGLPVKRESLAPRQQIDGFRFKWLDVCASPDATRIATVHGAKGTVWLTELSTGTIQKCKPAGVKLFKLAWGQRALVGVELNVPHVHVWNGQWSTRPVQCGPVQGVGWSPDGRHLAVASVTGMVQIIDWDAPGDSSTFRADPHAVYSACWLPDGEHVAVGHSRPSVGIYEAATGRLVSDDPGTLHFRREFEVGPHGEIVTSLFMDVVTVMHGKDRYDLPNSSNYGFSTGGFAGPDGSLLVTECHEGLVRIWRWRDGTLVGLVESAKKEPIAVLPDAVVYRDSKSRQLRVVALPGGSW